MASWMLAIVALALSASAEETSRNHGVALRECASILASNLAEMEATPQDACASGQRGMISINQTVQRFGRFQNVFVDSESGETLTQIDRAFRGERREMEQKQRLLRQMIDFLDDAPNAPSFTEVEIREQTARAKTMISSGIARVIVQLRVLDGQQSCTHSTLVKPARMYDGATVNLAATNPIGANGAPVERPANLSTLQGLHMQANFLDAHQIFTDSNNAYARQHQMLTYSWLYYGGNVAYEPCYGSGPYFPEGTACSGSMHSLPSSNMFGPDVSCASPSCMISEGNPSQVSWCDACPYGALQSSPQGSAQNSGWMMPFVGQMKQCCPGRQYPGRTCCGSHPYYSCCFNSGGHPAVPRVDLLEAYSAPTGQGYDADLVSILYALSAQHGSFSHVTFYTTTLTHLAVLGYYPNNVAWQHHGVQFTLNANSSKMVGKSLAGGASVLTVEMMSNGLLWALRTAELDPEVLHSTETYEFTSLSPQVIADYILDQKGTTYHDADCQGYARNLMQRVLQHGQGLKSMVPVVGAGEELTYRFMALILVGVVLIGLWVVAQWSIVLRSLMHLRGAPAGSIPAKIMHTWSVLVEDAQGVEEWIGAKFGGRVAVAAHYVVIALIILQYPPFFWTYTFWVAYSKMQKNTSSASIDDHYIVVE